ncbi:MAG TPA: family 43 glycosylhydrolase, partial [Rectinemataceae bacterium]|nr:family 43 glycosylhydrolase [Rectinemataceae bacterium]
MRYRNPVLPGFHPDPSVCRSGDSFYFVTSSFHYFPGIPIWKSSDLVDWKLIGHGISRPEQIDLSGTAASRGLFAPTIRASHGRFYITCTEVDRLGNFILSAPKPEGPWSEPLRLEVPGIDPSLFFDDDGTVYL